EPLDQTFEREASGRGEVVDLLELESPAAQALRGRGECPGRARSAPSPCGRLEQLRRLLGQRRVVALASLDERGAGRAPHPASPPPCRSPSRRIHSKCSRHDSLLGSTYTALCTATAPTLWSRRQIFTRK